MMLACLLALAGLGDEAQSLDCVRPSIQLVRIEGHAGIKPFLIGKFEVSNAQFRAFIADTDYDGSDFPTSKPSESFLMDWSHGSFNRGRERYPVSYLNWHHAIKFCEWLSRKSGRIVRLPTDAEWTLAAAGRGGRTFPWGNQWDAKRCNSGDQGKLDGFAESAPTGSFPTGATPEGVLDMAGNIWEWSAEGHLRGGPWCEASDWMKCAFIAGEDTNRCDDKFGLRVCVPVSE